MDVEQFLMPSDKIIVQYYNNRGVGEVGARGAVAPPLLGQLPPDPPRRGVLHTPPS